MRFITLWFDFFNSNFEEERKTARNKLFGYNLSSVLVSPFSPSKSREHRLKAKSLRNTLGQIDKIKDIREFYFNIFVQNRCNRIDILADYASRVIDYFHISIDGRIVKDNDMTLSMKFLDYVKILLYGERVKV